jgi:glycine/D-amino acid oxidase-like deaminating enzyme
MKSDPRTHGLWDVSAPPISSLPKLEKRLSADVAVVGGGFTGLSAALHLAESGAKVVVLEAEEIGFGGSGRNVGLVNAGLWIKPSQVLTTLGPTYGPRLLQNLAAAPALVFDVIARHGIACEAVQNGTLHCAVGARGLADIRARAHEWQERGAPVQLLDAKATAALVGSALFSGALLDARAGTIQPMAYVRGLATAALRQGASLYVQSPVVNMVDSGRDWTLATRAGEVSAPFVIIATNAYSSGPWASLQSELVKLPYFNFATKPLSQEQLKHVLPGRHGIWDSRLILSSARLDACGRLIFGSVGALKGHALKVHRDWAARSVRRLFPDLSSFAFEHEWFGSIGMTVDAVPRLHRLARNTYSVSGYNGRGIGPGTHFGRELAQLAAGSLGEQALSLPISSLSATSWRTAREKFYEMGSTAMHLTSGRLT